MKCRKLLAFLLALPLHLKDSYGELNENQVEGSTQVYVVALMLEREEGNPLKGL